MILCGAGNNGADGFALARRLSGRAKVTVIRAESLKTELCSLQALRAEKCGVDFLGYRDERAFKAISGADVIVDCAFGAGFHGALPEEIAKAVSAANESAAFRLSCDVPSGLDSAGNAAGAVFSADKTVGRSQNRPFQRHGERFHGGNQGLRFGASARFV